MDKAAIVALILQYGLKYGPTVMATIAGWFSGTPDLPTAEQWATLIAQCDTTSRKQLLDVLGILKIDPNSDQGKALLSNTP